MHNSCKHLLMKTNFELETRIKMFLTCSFYDSFVLLKLFHILFPFEKDTA